MADQGQQVAVYGSLRDVLRALEQEDDDDLITHWSPDFGRSDRAGAGPKAVLAEVEHRPIIDGGSLHATDGVAPLRWLRRIDLGSASASLGMAVPVLGLIFAGALLFGPLPESDWASAALSVPTALTPESPAGLQRLEDGVAAFALLGSRALAGGDQPSVHAGLQLAAKPEVAPRPGETVDLPFTIANATALPQGAGLIVRGLPENVALSAAEPQPDGGWVVPIDRAADVKLTAYALPARPSQELVAELQSGTGAVLARATTKLNAAAEPGEHSQAVAQAEPSPAPAPAVMAVSTEPPAQRAKRRSSSAVSSWVATVSQPAESQLTAASQSEPAAPATGGQSPEREKPEWMQPWNRSALGGAR